MAQEHEDVDAHGSSPGMTIPKSSNSARFHDPIGTYVSREMSRDEVGCAIRKSVEIVENGVRSEVSTMRPVGVRTV
jgi:hypothetical protein